MLNLGLSIGIFTNRLFKHNRATFIFYFYLLFHYMFFILFFFFSTYYLYYYYLLYILIRVLRREGEVLLGMKKRGFGQERNVGNMFKFLNAGGGLFQYPF